MKIRILNSAIQDLIDGYYFYEKQGAGLGIYFLETLFSDIDSLRIYAGIHSVHFERYHRLLSKRFPFAGYYRIEDDMILVYAVLDCRKSPDWIKKSLK